MEDGYSQVSASVLKGRFVVIYGEEVSMRHVRIEYSWRYQCNFNIDTKYNI
jgi:hypothetical protein